jgi:hypothetical protein
MDFITLINITGTALLHYVFIVTKWHTSSHHRQNNNSMAVMTIGGSPTSSSHDGSNKVSDKTLVAEEVTYITVSAAACIRESDCSIFMVDSPAGIGVRSLPSSDDKYKTGRSFNHKDLVSVDSIQPITCGMRWRAPNTISKSKAKDLDNTLSNNGPYLQLSDDSGWLFESKGGRKVLRHVPVLDGLWTFYIHNPPYGLHLRWHPVDREEFRIRRDEEPQLEHLAGIDEDGFVVLWPTQKIYCDKRIIHPISGVNYYRVQGTRGWVFDRKPGHRRPYLLDEHLVRKGMFAYQNLTDTPLEVRAWATVDDDARTGRLVHPTDVIIVDIKVEETNTVPSDVNGPFLHLTDGRGWLFQNKGSNKDILTRIAIEQGYWAFKVVSQAGVSTRSILTTGEKKSKHNTPLYACNSLIKCDRRIQASDGLCYYRVIDTNGWILDGQNGMPVVELLRNSPFSPTSDKADPLGNQQAWDPNFVRGIAAVCIPGGIEEIEFDEIKGLMRFSYTKDTLINVFFLSRTVGIEVESETYGKTQIFRKNCNASNLFEIMKDPQQYAENGLQRKTKDGSMYTILNTPAGFGYLIEEEEEIRSNLASSRLEIRNQKLKQATMLRDIKVFEDHNRLEAKKIKDESDKLKQRSTQSNMPPPNQQSPVNRSSPIKGPSSFPAIAPKPQKTASSSMSPVKVRMFHQTVPEQFTCQVCLRVFQNAQYLNHHRRDIHGLECNHCFKIFNTHLLLKRHRETENHW